MRPSPKIYTYIYTYKYMHINIHINVYIYIYVYNHDYKKREASLDQSHIYGEGPGGWKSSPKIASLAPPMHCLIAGLKCSGFSVLRCKRHNYYYGSYYYDYSYYDHYHIMNVTITVLNLTIITMNNNDQLACGCRDLSSPTPTLT